MPIDIATLAASLVGKILLPYAKLGLSKIGEKLKEKADTAVKDHATSLTTKVWEKVTSLFKSDKEKLALEQLKEEPEAAAPIFTKALERKLQESPEDAEALQKMLNEPIASMGGATFQDIMADTFGFVDARAATIHGGQVAGVIVGSTPPPRPPKR